MIKTSSFRSKEATEKLILQAISVIINEHAFSYTSLSPDTAAAFSRFPAACEEEAACLWTGTVNNYHHPEKIDVVDRRKFSRRVNSLVSSIPCEHENDTVIGWCALNLPFFPSKWEICSLIRDHKIDWMTFVITINRGSGIENWLVHLLNIFLIFRQD